MKLKLSKEWCEERFAKEANQEIGAGRVSAKPMKRRQITAALKAIGWTRSGRKWYAPKMHKYPKMFQNGVALRAAASYECYCSDENLG